jgi:hypothetical protein
MPPAHRRRRDATRVLFPGSARSGDLRLWGAHTLTIPTDVKPVIADVSSGRETGLVKNEKYRKVKARLIQPGPR